MGKLIEHKLHATLQMAAGAGIGTALGKVKQLLKGNVRKPCISRIVVAHLKIDHALALVNTIKTHLVILKNAHELRRLKPRDSCIERDQNTLKRPICRTSKIAILLNAIQISVLRTILIEKLPGLYLFSR